MFNYPIDVDLDSANNRSRVVDLFTLFSVDLTSGDRTVISDDTIGTGPEFYLPDAVAFDNLNNRALVISGLSNALISVALTSGDRTVISDDTIGTGPELFFPNSVALDNLAISTANKRF